MVGDLEARGWVRLGFHTGLQAWARAADALTDDAMADPRHAQWWDCEDTWFIGVDALDNDAEGRLPDGTELPSELMADIHLRFGRYPLHKAQVSVVRPGYPRPRRGESEAGLRYRRNRDAAHVDGLKMQEGPGRRRAVEEPHAYILGLPLNDAPIEAAPMVVWEGSHEIMRAAMTEALAPYPVEDWGRVDVTDIYQAARREVFETCERVLVHARPGEAYLLHRLALHGVAPWAAPEVGDRRIAYFRPAVETVKEWLERP